ncbi:histamine H2 receptor-like [Nematostella vectensis]|nr:histamine H2 receptor-like [Nematostella vectensis]
MNNTSFIPQNCEWPIEVWHTSLAPHTTRVIYMAQTIVHAVTCPFTITLNLLVIIAIVKFPFLRSSHNIIIACLASVDFLTGAIVQTSLVVNNLKSLFSLQRSPCASFTSNLIFKILILCSLLHVTLLNIDRHIAIKKTFDYPFIVTDRRIAYAVALAWVLSAFLSVDILVPAMKIPTAMFWGACLLACAYCCVTVLLESRRHKRQIIAQNKSIGVSSYKQSSSSTISLIITALCLFSYILALVVTKSSILRPVSNTFVVLNSLCNAIIYIARNGVFRRAFKKIIGIHGGPIHDIDFTSDRKRQGRQDPDRLDRQWSSVLMELAIIRPCYQESEPDQNIAEEGCKYPMPPGRTGVNGSQHSEIKTPKAGSPLEYTTV